MFLLQISYFLLDFGQKVAGVVYVVSIHIWMQN